MLVRQLQWRATSYGSRDRAPSLKRGVAREVGSKSSLFIQVLRRIQGSRFVNCGSTLWADKEAPVKTRIGALVLLILPVVFAGSGASNTAVNWTVREGAAGGSITSMGVYTAPNRSGTFHVIATSQADMTSSA